MEVNSILDEVKLLTKINVGRTKVITPSFFLLTLQLYYNLVHYYQIASADRTGEIVSVLSLTVNHQHFTI